MNNQTHTTADIHQEKVFEALVFTGPTVAATSQTELQTYAKSRMFDRRLDAIQNEMGA
jgi:hypothetical protein